MNHLYAFLEIHTEVSNTVPNFSTVGECSPFCKTFVPAKDSPYINRKTDCSLYYFNGEFPDNGAEILATYTNALSTLANQAQTGGMHLGVAGTADIVWVQSKFPSQTVTAIGSQVTLASSGNNIVDYFEIVVPAGGFDYTIHTWLAHTKCKAEYPLAYYTVVPPIIPNELTPNDYTANLQFVNGNFTAIKGIVSGRTLSQHMDNTQTYLSGKVNSGIETVTLRAYNPANPADYFDCPFFLGYNGELGINWVGQVQAIMDFFLGLGGGFDEDDWNQVFPQLSSLGTFYLIPIWNREAIPNPNPSLPAIMYNPSQALFQGSDICSVVRTNYLNGGDIAYSLANVQALLEYAVSSYKSIGFFVMPDPTNDNSTPVSFSNRFTDYIVANINTLGSSNLTVITENIIRDIHMTLQQAEAWIDTNPAPEGYAIETMNGKKYISLVNPYGRAKINILALDQTNPHPIN